jgi:transcriptional regulator with XRE-family HTH domain
MQRKPKENQAILRLAGQMHERIQQARQAAGFSKSELARALGLSPTSCICWELPAENKNASRPSARNLARIALVLDVSLEWLATGRGGMRPDHLEGSAFDEEAQEFLSPEERALLQAYIRLPSSKRKALLALMEGLSEGAEDRGGAKRRPGRKGAGGEGG